MTPDPFIYLASPYSHPDATIRKERYTTALAACRALWKSGVAAYVPIAYTHPIAEVAPELGAKMYQAFDDRILAIADELWVLKLDGWETSTGVQYETLMAQLLGKPVRYVDLDQLLHTPVPPGDET